MKRIVTILTLSALILVSCNDSTNKINSTIRPSTESNIMTYPVKNISISIKKTADEVYQFASNPENFHVWVEFVKSMTKEKENIWSAETDLGNLKIEFVVQNDFGIIDHLVTLPDGTVINNPMRVIANGNGCEFIFTLFWMPDKTEEEFNQDAKMVESDLQKLKKILEKE